MINIGSDHNSMVSQCLFLFSLQSFLLAEDFYSSQGLVLTPNTLPSPAALHPSRDHGHSCGSALIGLINIKVILLLARRVFCAGYPH